MSDRHGADPGALVGPGRRVPPRTTPTPATCARCCAGACDEGDARRGLRICTAIRPCWIVRGSFAEGAEWLDAFLAAARRRGAAPRCAARPWSAGRQLALAAATGARRLGAGQRGWSCAGRPGSEFWTAAALNLLTETALHAGQITDGGQPGRRGARAGPAGRRPVERGLRARHQGAPRPRCAATCARPQELAEAALVVMRDIDQQWGAARTLLGLGDLARLRRDLRRRPRATTWPPWASCARSTPARRSPGAWPAWAGSRWSRATWPRPASTWPTACG